MSKTTPCTKTHQLNFVALKRFPHPGEKVEVFDVSYFPPGLFRTGDIDYLSARRLGLGVVRVESKSYPGYWLVRMDATGRDAYVSLNEFGPPTHEIVHKDATRIQKTQLSATD